MQGEMDRATLDFVLKMRQQLGEMECARSALADDAPDSAACEIALEAAQQAFDALGDFLEKEAVAGATPRRRTLREFAPAR